MVTEAYISPPPLVETVNVASLLFPTNGNIECSLLILTLPLTCPGDWTQYLNLRSCNKNNGLCNHFTRMLIQYQG